MWPSALVSSTTTSTNATKKATSNPNSGWKKKTGLTNFALLLPARKSRSLSLFKDPASPRHHLHNPYRRNLSQTAHLGRRPPPKPLFPAVRPGSLRHQASLSRLQCSQPVRLLRPSSLELTRLWPRQLFLLQTPLPRRSRPRRNWPRLQRSCRLTWQSFLPAFIKRLRTTKSEAEELLVSPLRNRRSKRTPAKSRPTRVPVSKSETNRRRITGKSIGIRQTEFPRKPVYPIGLLRKPAKSAWVQGRCRPIQARRQVQKEPLSGADFCYYQGRPFLLKVARNRRFALDYG